MNPRTPEKKDNSSTKTPKDYGKIKVSPVSKYNEQDHQVHQSELAKPRPNTEYIMDEEIIKIRNRIEESENERKRLEQKYAQYSNKSHKTPASEESSENRVSHSNYIARTQQENISYARKEVEELKEKGKASEFHLKIYPCQ